MKKYHFKIKYDTEYSQGFTKLITIESDNIEHATKACLDVALNTIEGGFNFRDIKLR